MQVCKDFFSEGYRQETLKKFGHHPMLLEKAFKCFAAMAMVCNPVGTTHEFLIDSGAGRNLISQKMMPEEWGHFLLMHQKTSSSRQVEG